jgi:hypothetical protein
MHVIQDDTMTIRGCRSVVKDVAKDDSRLG